MMLSSSAEELLKDLLATEKSGQQVSQVLIKRVENDKSDAIERGIIGELVKRECLVVSWADDLPLWAELTQTGRSYFEMMKRNLTKVLPSSNIRKVYDLFLSHANQDKIDYVDDLYMSLKRLGINIFYDKEELAWGDNWKDRILSGVRESEFAIIVISENFFGREWTERELNEFLQLQNESGQKIILPLLYNIDFEDLKGKYPELEFIQSIKSTSNSNETITIMFAKELLKRYKSQSISIQENDVTKAESYTAPQECDTKTGKQV